MRKLYSLLLMIVAAVSALAQQNNRDYRSRTIYFLLADRFNPQHPYDPYVDPLFPDATNSLDCFTQTCSQEEEFRKYWGGESWLVPGTYRGLIAHGSPANAGNYVRIGRQTSLVHLGAISALVLRN